MNQFSWRPLASKQVWGWSFYDFANSAFATTILAVIFNKYYAQVVAGGEQGALVFGFRIQGAALFGYVASFSYAVVALSSPILGAIADYSHAKKKFWAVFMLTGVVFTGMLYFVRRGDYWLGAVLFIMANFGFAGGNVFYNSFLPEICEKRDMSVVSGLGWAMGYLGGGLLLAVNLVMLQFPQAFGLAKGAFTVLDCFLSVSIWWLVFSIPTFLWVREAGRRPQAGAGGNYVAMGFNRIWRTLKASRRYSQFRTFLIAYLFFNDGIETVIIFASIFGAQVVGMETTELILFFLTIQGTAFLGSLACGALAHWLGNKRALIVTLFVWIIVVVWGFKLGIFGSLKKEYWILGIMAGTVLGGSQAIARSLAATFIPRERSAEFFGFYNIAGRFAAIFGPAIFSAALSITGDMRASILSLIILFIVGLVLLLRIDEHEGLRQSEQDAAF